MTNIENIFKVEENTLGQKIKAIFGIKSDHYQHKQQEIFAQQFINEQITNKVFKFTSYNKITKGTTYRLQPSKWRDD